MADAYGNPIPKDSKRRHARYVYVGPVCVPSSSPEPPDYELSAPSSGFFQRQPHLSHFRKTASPLENAA